MRNNHHTHHIARYLCVEILAWMGQCAERDKGAPTSLNPPPPPVQAVYLMDREARVEAKTGDGVDVRHRVDCLLKAISACHKCDLDAAQVLYEYEARTAYDSLLWPPPECVLCLVTNARPLFFFSCCSAVAVDRFPASRYVSLRRA